ncbi:MAG TPA: transaldolase [Steroidobacteraceae bacterium]|jgi:transaldolase|nr:transaldolase [Steroidobacteraceae bacterium]
MPSLHDLRIKLFADGADRAQMLDMHARPHIRGLTTNPSLMRRAGVADYRAFAREVLAEIRDKPVCFEVLADDLPEIERQALEIAGWADNVFVKIPVTNTRRQSCAGLIERLAHRGVQINVTAILTLAQVRESAAALSPAVQSFVSVFAGRIADTGTDPLPLMSSALELLRANPHAELIWASCRELINIFQADAIGCPVITVAADVLAKLPLIGYDLAEFSLDTVKMFHDDACRAGFSL